MGWAERPLFPWLYVYGYSCGRCLFEAGTPHAFVCDQTGSGKTRYQNLLTLDLATFGGDGWNVVASDVKNELVELCGPDQSRRCVSPWGAPGGPGEHRGPTVAPRQEVRQTETRFFPRLFLTASPLL